MTRLALGVDRPVPILAVDDTPSNLVAWSALTDNLGVELFTASSGKAALEQFSQREFALVLLDVMMPDMDGLETLARLSAVSGKRTTPVILVTAVDLSRSLMGRAYALGAVDYLTKPLDVGAVHAKINTFGALYRQELEIRRQAEALRAKEECMAILAHDLRTPLGIILSGISVMQELPDPRVRTVCARAKRAIRRMEELTADVLVFAQASEGRLVPVKTPGDLSATCVELISDFQASYPKVRFECNIPEQICGSFDAARINQALSNLLLNAVKYGDNRVAVSLACSESSMTIEVTNGGTAIPPERIPFLFERFERASETQPGTGLGLYIVRAIARAHGGDVTVVSDEDRTVFTLRLPR